MKKWISNILIVLNAVQAIWIAFVLLAYSIWMYVPYLVIGTIFIVLSIVGFLSVRGFGKTSGLTLFLLTFPLILGVYILCMFFGYKFGFVY